MFKRLHNKLGDFWWYSLMLFCACRAADLLNALVGLWLVPKYVDPSELGAVMPLANFANFLALPAAIFANTFRNELTRLSVSHEFGKLKTLMRSVFIATAIFLFVAIVVSRIVLPIFLERIRIIEGSLGALIIISSFIGVVCPVFNNALQSLKKFRSSAVINVVGAPIRFLTMLVAMPIRALSGYFVGSAATPAFNIVAAVFCLRKELSVPAEPYWEKPVIKRFATLFLIFAISGIAGGFSGLVESTILRQRLTDLASAGYYMATRFSEIASFLSATLSFTLFPFAADLAARRVDTRPLIIKISLASLGFSALIAIPFVFFGQTLLAILPHGDQYATYWWAIPWLIGIGAVNAFVGFYTTAEISANRFGFMKWMVPLDILYPVFLLLVTGYGYLENILPANWFAFLKAHNIYSLDTMLLWITAIAAIKSMFCAKAMIQQRIP